jgi:hypothetical protein
VRNLQLRTVAMRTSELQYRRTPQNLSRGHSNLILYVKERIRLMGSMKNLGTENLMLP